MNRGEGRGGGVWSERKDGEGRGRKGKGYGRRHGKEGRKGKPGKQPCTEEKWKKIRGEEIRKIK